MRAVKTTAFSHGCSTVAQPKNGQAVYCFYILLRVFMSIYAFRDVRSGVSYYPFYQNRVYPSITAHTYEGVPRFVRVVLGQAQICKKGPQSFIVCEPRYAAKEIRAALFGRPGVQIVGKGQDAIGDRDNAIFSRFCFFAAYHIAIRYMHIGKRHARKLPQPCSRIYVYKRHFCRVVIAMRPYSMYFCRRIYVCGAHGPSVLAYDDVREIIPRYGIELYGKRADGREKPLSIFQCGLRHTAIVEKCLNVARPYIPHRAIRKLCEDLFKFSVLPYTRL